MKSEEIDAFLAEYLPLRDSQIGIFTDSIVVRNLASGQCGLASCIYIEWEEQLFAISCNHILKAGHEYITGAKRITGSTINENDSHAVAPITLIDSNKGLDLALFDLNGLDISSIPKRAVKLSDINFSRASANSNLGCLSFIHGLPSFAAGLTQYPDEMVFMSSPIYSACGPIVEISDDLIVGDFAEKECHGINTDAFPKFSDFEPCGGTRYLGGMSGSGLWVNTSDQFCLLGILLGAAEDNDERCEHRICFTPVWKVKEWLINRKK